METVLSLVGLGWKFQGVKASRRCILQIFFAKYEREPVYREEAPTFFNFFYLRLDFFRSKTKDVRLLSSTFCKSIFCLVDMLFAVKSKNENISSIFANFVFFQNVSPLTQFESIDYSITSY